MKIACRFVRRLAWAGIALGIVMHAPVAHGQVTAADSAAVLYGLAQQVRDQGDTRLALELMRLVVRRFPNTPAAANALALLTAERTRERGSGGRAGLIVSNTLFGAWLGLAIPAAFGADSPEPYGAGLLLGAPTGFATARLFSDRRPVSAGQAIATSFGGWWGTWQGLAIREVFDIGSTTETYCYFDGVQEQCDTWEQDSPEAAFAAAAIGGISGLIAGAALSQSLQPSAGTATTIQFASLWGTWYGLAASILADVDDGDARMAYALIGGNAGLLTSAIGSRHWQISAGRAWLISAAGLAGGVAGLGVDLLFEVDDAQTAMLAPTLLSLGGLAAGVALTTDFDAGGFGRRGTSALIDVSSGSPTLGLVLPTPIVVKRLDRGGRTRMSLGASISLVSARF